MDIIPYSSFKLPLAFVIDWLRKTWIFSGWEQPKWHANQKSLQNLKHLSTKQLNLLRADFTFIGNLWLRRLIKS